MRSFPTTCRGGISPPALLVLLLSTLSFAANPGDLATLRARYLASLLPTDPEESAILLRSAQDIASRMTTDHTWSDIDFTDKERNNWHVRPHLERALLLAKAAAIATRDHRADPSLTRASAAALDYWLARDLKNPNWWWNEIGVPQLTGETALLLGDACPAPTRDGVVNLMKRSVWAKWTGQNLVWGVTNQITRGLLTADADLISQAYARLYDEIVITTKDGIQPDYSFHQHGDQLYSGGYGLGFANDVGRYIAFAWGTPWQPPPDKLDIYTHYMLDGQAWMTWGSLFDYSALGREIVRKGKSASPREWDNGPIVPVGRAYSLLQTTTLLSELTLPRAHEFLTFSERLAADPLSPPGPLVGHKHFWNSDYTLFRGRHFLFSLKMCSSRLFNSELVNDEGRLSHHLGDGNTFLYRTGSEYRDIFPVWDWNALPGTTAERPPVPPESRQAFLDKLLPHGMHVRGASEFVGGVSDGAHGASAMVLQRASLSAKKSWFFLGDQIICLGSSIACTSDNPVNTTVEQCLSAGPVTRDPGGRWVCHNGVGYVLPTPQTLAVDTRKQSGAWTDIGTTPAGPPVTASVFSARIDHGTHPKDASYAYAILPGASPAYTADRALHPDFAILAQTEAAHAVRYPRLGVTAIVFFAPATVAGVTADHPCILLLGPHQLTVSDPTQKLAVVTVTVADTPHKIDLPQGPIAGSSVTVAVP